MILKIGLVILGIVAVWGFATIIAAGVLSKRLKGREEE